ncbi:hypothetical protein HID58_073921 [Brassica napus]|uniref:Uncharacterized protein n=1 Tax=Brassica napus TaxID=3708 RepID=A0ABQ7YFB3_BRANA|nr:hypothetical protein HID58_073921 [Brassica napus]
MMSQNRVHTGIVVYGNEYFFGGGIQYLPAVPMIQNLETTLRAGAVPNAPQFRPQTEPFGAFSKDEGPKLPNKPSENQIKSEKASKSEDAKTSVPTEKASQVSQASSNKEKVEEDPLGDARTKIQEEITREFAALMAQGTLRASEAAVMATKE